MQEQVKSVQIEENIRQKFTVPRPCFLLADADSLKLELKPYLQPFERVLAMRELQALLDGNEQIVEEHGYHIVKTDKPEEFFRQRLTYWQRVGRRFLEPTVQEVLEFTQNGLSETSKRQGLHGARRLRYGPHDLHEYRGKFFPQLVRSLINVARVPDYSLILDPMCGSGTTPCEALASHRSAIGADLNPLSVLISIVKSALVLEMPAVFHNTISSHLSRFRFKSAHPESNWSDDDLNYLRRWFPSEAIKDLSAVLAEIDTVQEPLYRDFFRVCLSNIIRSVSWQKDSDLRVRKEIRPYDTETAIVRFKEETIRQLERIHPYLCVLQHTTQRSFFSIRLGDAVRVADLFSEYHGKVDMLITSPPYATALPYLDTDRLSLIVLGLLPRRQHRYTEAAMIGTREVTERQRREAWEIYLARRNELPGCVTTLVDRIAKHNHTDMVGFRRRNLPSLLGKYFLDMLDAMRSAHLLMRAGAPGHYVVGNNSTMLDSQKTEIPTNEFLFEIGAAAGWHQRETIPMELLASRDIFRENRGSAETILCFVA